ncbi:hypothetical protein [Xanthomonas sacchari]|nr:hypothetical protein [Xanthomonas sacchari]
MGNVADWAGVGVALFVGIAVGRLTRAANATARGAKEIQELDAVQRRKASEREARLILIYLEGEFRQAHSAIERLVNGLGIVEHDAFVMNGNARRNFAVDANAISLQLSRELFGRLHVLDDTDADDIARAISALQYLQQSAVEAEGVDLTESMPGVDGESWNKFRMGFLSSAYSELCAASAVLKEILSRLINQCGSAKTAAGATPPAHPREIPYG